jgi:YhcH/YjgK/YiaL family protein
MILDRSERADLYTKLHPRFADAIAFLRETNWADIADGRHPIDGDELFVLVETSNGKGREGGVLESHLARIDIQLCLSGSERIGWKPTPECTVKTPFQPGGDIAFYHERPETWLELPPGTFAILFPADAHAPGSGDGPFRKAVVKVRVDPAAAHDGRT